MKKSIVLTLCTLVCLTLAGCGKPSPTKVTQTWFDALMAGDLNKANSLTVEQGQMLNAFMVEAVKKAKQDGEALPTVTIKREEIDGDTAKVYFIDPDGKEDSVTLEKVNGEWKVAPKKNK